MAAAVTRELQVVYGTHTSGGTTEQLIHSFTRQGDAFTEATWEMNVVIYAATAAALKTACIALETAYRTPRKDLVVTMGGETFVSWKHSDNTGFNADPHIEKVVPSKFNTGRSREYRISIRFGRPADVSDTSGRRDSRASLTRDPSRIGTATISGSYTALSPATSGRAAYTAAAATYATAVLATFGGTWELVDEDATSDDQDKVCDFRLVYRELISSQGGASFNDTALVRQVLMVERVKEAPGDTSSSARRLMRLSATFQAHVDKTITTDLKGKFQSIVAWIVGRVRSIYGVSSIALVHRQEAHNYDDNVIQANLGMLATASPVIEYRVSIRDKNRPGGVVVPFWVSGEPLAARKYQGPAVWMRTITETAEIAGWNAPFFVFANIPNPGDDVNIEEIDAGHDPVIRGMDGHTLKTMPLTRTTVYRFFAAVRSGSDGSSRGAGPRRVGEVAADPPFQAKP